MKLSVVIVNYNVEFFLEQCLQSVAKAMAGIDAEVFVVDNHSHDGSLEMLANKFPWVNVVANNENVGFAKANNQAIKMAQGEFVLLLNPDTVVEEDTFKKTLHFMDETPDCGGLGVKMINGKGDFLPESKRGLPVPSVAFYKIFGLSKFFPKSKRFGTYHLSYLDNNEIHSVEVLSGAFMLIRKSVLDTVGGLDEDYFMYGEDIDLSYMILQNGYKNYYYPETQIIHYKGESTKNESLNYVFVFYRAMQIFAKKHFAKNNAGLLNLLINFAIWFRASLAMAKRIFLSLLLPVLDYILIFAGLIAIAMYWEYAVLAPKNSHFPDIYFTIVLPLCSLLWILTICAFKGYKKPTKINRTHRGVFAGIIILFLIYAVLPETYRFSRAVMIFGTMWAAIATNSIRYLLNKLKIKNFNFSENKNERILILGDGTEAQRVRELTQMTIANIEFLGTVNYQINENKDKWCIGQLSDLETLIKKYRIQELIFCAKDIKTSEIINWMEKLRETKVEYKIAPENTNSIIGADEIRTSEDLLHRRAI